MIKKILLPIIILSIVLLDLIPIQAGESLIILDSSAKANFPSQLSFHLSARNDSVISDIRLRYAVERTQFARVFSEAFIEFTPSSTVNVDWALDMVKIGGLPPGTKINYWWLVKDVAGKQTSTAPERINFDDNRHPWQSITADKITIYWYDGKQSFAAELANIARQALARLAEYTGARLEKPVSIYVYPSAKDLRGAMIFPQEWTGGVAFTRFGVVTMTIEPDDLPWAREVIPHELTHQVTQQLVLNPYNDIPTWLAEGLALYIEGKLASDLKGYLDSGIAKNNLISVRSLCSPFSAYRDEAALSYAQSYSLVDFLITSYGQSKMLELLETFKQGSSYDSALSKVYGFNLDGLDSLWRDYVGAPVRQAEKVSPVPVPAGK